MKHLDKHFHSVMLAYFGYSYGVDLHKATRNVQLGILYLGTVLKNNGYKVNILCTDFPYLDEIIEKIRNNHIAIVGFYTITDNINRCVRCADILKDLFPELIILMGGPHASVLDKEILETYKSVDIIVRGEGEYTLLGLTKFFYDGSGELKNIKGITYRENNEIRRNDDAPFVSDLDSLPFPDRDLLEEPVRSTDIFYPRIITGRGCPFKCAFCYEGFHGSVYRMRSAEDVLGEVDSLIKRGEIGYILFLDDTFSVHPQRTMKICKGLRNMSEEGRNFVWFSEGRVDVLSKYPRMIYAMKLAGLAVIQLGVECADQKILDMYEKHITLEQIEEVIKICVDARIPSVSINFILGGPFESGELYEKNLNFVRKLMKIAPGRLNVSSTLLAPFYGTGIMKEPARFGLKIIDRECKTGITNKTCFCETDDMNEYELTRLRIDFDREVLNIMIDASKDLTRDIIYEIFSVKYFGVDSQWTTLLSSDRGIKRFINLKLHEAYCAMDEVNEHEILNYYPVRTYPLVYDDNNRVIFYKIYGKEILNDIDSRLYEYSSGKRTFGEILKIAKEKLFRDLPAEEVYNRLKDFYVTVDKLYGVIFSKI